MNQGRTRIKKDKGKEKETEITEIEYESKLNFNNILNYLNLTEREESIRINLRFIEDTAKKAGIKAEKAEAPEGSSSSQTAPALKPTKSTRSSLKLRTYLQSQFYEENSEEGIEFKSELAEEMLYYLGRGEPIEIISDLKEEDSSWSEFLNHIIKFNSNNYNNLHCSELEWVKFLKQFNDNDEEFKNLKGKFKNLKEAFLLGIFYRYDRDSKLKSYKGAKDREQKASKGLHEFYFRKEYDFCLFRQEPTYNEVKKNRVYLYKINDQRIGYKIKVNEKDRDKIIKAEIKANDLKVAGAFATFLKELENLKQQNLEQQDIEISECYWKALYKLISKKNRIGQIEINLNPGSGFFHKHRSLRLGRQKINAFSLRMKAKTQNYIHSLFPNRHVSGDHPEAPQLTYALRKALRRNTLYPEEGWVYEEKSQLEKEASQLRKNQKESFLIENFKAMLAFYGLELVDKNVDEGKIPKVQLAADFHQRTDVWLTPGNHNYDDISQILTSLRECGLQKEAEAFFKLLARLKLDSRCAVFISDETFEHWQKAMALEKSETLRYEVIKGISSRKNAEETRIIERIMEELNDDKTVQEYGDNGTKQQRSEMIKVLNRMLQPLAGSTPESSPLHSLINSNEGCDLYLMSKLPDNDVNVNGSEYESSYIWLKNNQKLYYVHQGMIEEVKIDDIDLFKSVLTNNNNEDKQHLSSEEIKKYITLNGGHTRNEDHKFDLRIYQDGRIETGEGQSKKDVRVNLKYQIESIPLILLSKIADYQHTTKPGTFVLVGAAKEKKQLYQVNVDLKLDPCDVSEPEKKVKSSEEPYDVSEREKNVKSGEETSSNCFSFSSLLEILDQDASELTGAQLFLIKSDILKWDQQRYIKIDREQIQKFRSSVVTIFDDKEMTPMEAQDIQLIKAGKRNDLQLFFGLLRAFRRQRKGNDIKNNDILEKPNLFNVGKKLHYSSQQAVAILIATHKLKKDEIKVLKDLSQNDEEIVAAITKHYGANYLAELDSSVVSDISSSTPESSPDVSSSTTQPSTQLSPDALLKSAILSILESLEESHSHYRDKTSYADLQRDLAQKTRYMASIGEVSQVFDKRSNVVKLDNNDPVTQIATTLCFPDLSSSETDDFPLYTSPGKKTFNLEGAIRYKNDIKRILTQGILLSNQYAVKKDDTQKYEKIGLDCPAPTDSISGLTPKHQAIAHRLFAQAALELAQDRQFAGLNNFLGLSLHATPEVAETLRRFWHAQKDENSAPLCFNLLIADERANALTPQRILQENDHRDVGVAVSLMVHPLRPLIHDATNPDVKTAEANFGRMSAGLVCATLSPEYNPRLLDLEQFTAKSKLWSRPATTEEFSDVKFETDEEEVKGTDEKEAMEYARLEPRELLVKQAKMMIRILSEERLKIEKRIDEDFSEQKVTAQIDVQKGGEEQATGKGEEQEPQKQLSEVERKKLMNQYRNILHALKCFDLLISAEALYHDYASEENAEKLFEECQFNLNLGCAIRNDSNAARSEEGSTDPSVNVSSKKVISKTLGGMLIEQNALELLSHLKEHGADFSGLDEANKKRLVQKLVKRANQEVQELKAKPKKMVAKAKKEVKKIKKKNNQETDGEGSTDGPSPAIATVVSFGALGIFNTKNPEEKRKELGLDDGTFEKLKKEKEKADFREAAQSLIIYIYKAQRCFAKAIDQQYFGNFWPWYKLFADGSGRDRQQDIVGHPKQLLALVEKVEKKLPFSSNIDAIDTHVEPSDASATSTYAGNPNVKRSPLPSDIEKWFKRAYRGLSEPAKSRVKVLLTNMAKLDTLKNELSTATQERFERSLLDENKKKAIEEGKKVLKNAFPKAFPVDSTNIIYQEQKQELETPPILSHQSTTSY